MELKEREKKVWEGLSSPEHPERPLIHLKERREDGCFEAVFCLKLDGVARVRNERRDGKDPEQDAREQYINSFNTANVRLSEAGFYLYRRKKRAGSQVLLLEDHRPFNGYC